MIGAALMRNMLSERKTRDALKAMDWPGLQAELESCGLTQEALDDALGHLLRENDLIFPYPNPKKEEKRAKFISEFREYVLGALGEEAAKEVSDHADLQALVESQYRRILNKLDECDVSKLEAGVRVSACISHAAHEYDHMIRRMDELVGKSTDFGTFFQGPLAAEEDKLFHPDGVLEGIVVSLTSTLIMEAHKNKWFDADGHAVIPTLPKIGDHERYMAGSTELLAFVWRAWRKTERRLRFVGAHIEEFSASAMPEWAPKGAEAVSVFNPTEDEFYDYVASERLGDRFTQHFIEMHTELDVRKKVAPRGTQAALPPVAFISEEEVHAAVTLSDILSYSIADDRDAPGGLRLVEWLRGYAVLRQLAEETGYHEHGNPEVLVPVVDPDDIVERLIIAGLSDERADKFVACATLGKDSRDVFDCPLIKTDAGKYLLFAPAMLQVNLSQVVLSAISTLGETLDRKGKAFERDALSMLNAAGLEAKAFKVKRDGEEYEYDAVLPWDDYVFVFECKHHGLSQRNPERAYYFALEARSNAKQVNRLAEALRKYPDILAEKFGSDMSRRQVVPVVLNALPYSRKGQLNGVYFTDSSALGRFLKERYCHIVVHHSVSSDVRLRHRVAVHSFWSGAKPTATDLLRHLNEPFQITTVEQHTHRRATPFNIGDKEWIVAVEFERSAMNIETIAEAAKVKAGLVRSDLETVADVVRETQVQVKKGAKKPKRPTVRRSVRASRKKLGK